MHSATSGLSPPTYSSMSFAVVGLMTGWVKGQSAACFAAAALRDLDLCDFFTRRIFRPEKWGLEPVLTSERNYPLYTSYGFLRTFSNMYASFDPPGSVSTTPAAITPSGEIIGYYYDANYVAHGFLASSHDDETEGLAGGD
jgi:hypothetical protein